MKDQRSVLCQYHISMSSYYSGTDRLQYPINLVTRVLVNFEHKKILVSTIGLTLILFLCLVLARGMPNCASYLFVLC